MDQGGIMGRAGRFTAGFFKLLLALFLIAATLTAGTAQADTLLAGESTAALGFSYGTNAQDVTTGDSYLYVENDLAKAVISKKIGANNAQGTFQKGWLADFVLKDSKKVETLDWTEMVLSSTLEAGWGFGTRDIDLSNTSMSGTKVIASGSWLSDPSLAVSASYRMIPNAPIVKITVHLANNGSSDFNGYFEYLLDPDGTGAQDSYIPGKGWNKGLVSSGWTSNYIYSGTQAVSTSYPAHGIAWLGDQPVALNGQNYIFGAWFNASVAAGASRDITFYHITAWPSATPTYDRIGSWAAQLSTLDQELVNPTAAITGQVVDGATDQGIASVKVVAKDINANTVASATTGSTGSFQMQLPVGTYTLTATRLAYQLGSKSLEVAVVQPYSLNIPVLPVTAWAGTGKTLNGTLVEGTATDIVMENQLVAMTIAKTFNDPQLPGATLGKPVDWSVQGLTDAIDWINLPYLSLTQPSGTEAWSSLKVVNSAVEVVESSAARAVVQATGSYTEVAGVGVVTRYTIEPEHPWIYAESTFTNNSGSDLTVWAGDALDLDEATQISYVPGVGDITAPYASPLPYTPSAPWMGMYGSSNQALGIIYDGDYAKGFVAYGNGNWIQSQKQIVIPKGASYTLNRYLVAAATAGFAQKMDAVAAVYNQLQASLLGVDASLGIAPSSGISQGSTVNVTLQVNNNSNATVPGVNATLLLPTTLRAATPLSLNLPDLAPNSNQTIVWPLTAVSGGTGFLSAAVTVNGQSVFSTSAKLFVNGAGWYSGDNHSHSVYSDGSGSIHDNCTSARNKGLSFLTATDHNSLSQKADMDLENSEDFVALTGQEVTSSYGHSLAYNISSLIDWTKTPQLMIDSVRANNNGAGMLFLAHPYYPGLEWKDWSVQNNNGIEVWNGFYTGKDPVNANAQAKWDELNRQGRHLQGLANSDAHNPGKVGDPHIKAYLPALSKENILEAIRQGRLFGTNGPDLTFTVNGAIMGSDTKVLPIANNVRIEVGGSYNRGVTAARLLKNGNVLESWTLSGTSMADAVLFDQASAGDFYRFEIDGVGNGFAFSNPIWISAAADVSAQLATTTSGFVYNRTSKTYNGTLTVTNNGAAALSGPFTILLNNLTSGVTLNGAAGMAGAYPYLAPAAPAALAPGESLKLSLSFQNPANAKIGFSPMTFR
jgi:hypothetical protein